MSDIALVMVEATQAQVGDIDIWPDDFHLFSEDVESDDVLIVRKPHGEERAEGLMEPLDNYSRPIDRVTEVVKPFWAFRLTSIGDWIGTYTNGVADVMDSGGSHAFQDDVPELVKMAERIQRENGQDSIPPDPDPCPIVNFVVAYQYVGEVSTDWNNGGEEYDYWCELLGEVDLDKIPQIIKGEK